MKNGRAQELVQELLRQMRTEANLSQYQLADELGVPQSTISKVESGKRRVDVAELVAVCDACGTAPKVFVAELEQRLGESRSSGDE